MFGETNTTGEIEMSQYKKGDKVQMRMNGTTGVVVDREDHPVYGWSFLVKFDSSNITRWYASTDLYHAS